MVARVNKSYTRIFANAMTPQSRTERARGWPYFLAPVSYSNIRIPLTQHPHRDRDHGIEERIQAAFCLLCTFFYTVGNHVTSSW